MTPTIRAVRAIMSLYAKSVLWPLLWVLCAAYVLTMAVIGWVAYVASPWWWLLAVVPSAALVIGLVVWGVVFALAHRLAPNLTSRQRRATRKFVAHIGRIAEHMGTPRVVLVFRIIKDIIAPPANGRTFISQLASEPGQMRREFEEVRGLFEEG